MTKEVTRSDISHSMSNCLAVDWLAPISDQANGNRVIVNRAIDNHGIDDWAIDDSVTGDRGFDDRVTYYLATVGKRKLQSRDVGKRSVGIPLSDELTTQHYMLTLPSSARGRQPRPVCPLLLQHAVVL